MILLNGVGKAYKVRDEERAVLDGLTIELPTTLRLGILGGPQSGKSTLLRLLSGLEEPTTGEIVRYAALSFPVGYNRAFRPNVSGRESVYHAARLYGADTEEVFDVVARVTELGPMLEEPMRRYPGADRTALAFALAYALPFDTYLIDEHIGVGSPKFRKYCMDMFEARAAESGIIMATSFARKVRDHCNAVGVIVDRSIRLFDDVQEGVDFYERLSFGAPAETAARGARQVAHP